MDLNRKRFQQNQPILQSMFVLIRKSGKIMVTFHLFLANAFFICALTEVCISLVDAVPPDILQGNHV